VQASDQRDDISAQETTAEEAAAAAEAAEASTLAVKAVVRVWVDINLPLPYSVAAVINILPIKLLVKQIAIIVANNILKILASAFASKLYQDYENRKFQI